MKRMFFGIFLVLFMTLTGLSVNAQEEINIKINDATIYFEHDLLNKDGRTFLPLRELCESMGISDIVYDPEYKMIFINSENKTLFMAIDMEYYQLNGQILNLDVPPMLVEDTTYVPVRFVAEAFDFEVAWDEASRSVLLTKKDYEAPEEFKVKPEPEPTYSEDDLYWLSKIVTVEARGMSPEGKLAIANVIYNRVKSSIYPNTVHDVIFQIDSGYVQFPPAHMAGFIEMEASEGAKQAALEALSGNNNIEDCLFFNNAPFSSKPEIFKIIEGEYFYK